MAPRPRRRVVEGYGVRNPDPIDIRVGAALRRARLARGLSQTQLAEAHGVSYQQVQKYERGTNRVSVSTLFRLAAALGVSPAQLVAEVEGESDG